MEIKVSKENQPAATKNDFDLMKPITKNWNLINEVEESFKERSGDYEAKFNATIFSFGAKRAIYLPMGFRKKKKTKLKGEHFTQKVYEQLIICHYCPFTGRPLYHEKKNHENEIHRIIQLAKEYVARVGLSKIPVKYRTWIIAKFIEIFKVEIKDI